MKEVEINLKGRPGWHIECSALALKYAGKTVDIHGGGGDLIFPHHENERAQSESANREQFVRYWMHTGFLTVDGEKMSKSLGNFITLSQSMHSISPNAHRLFFIQSHYRSPVNYDEEALLAAEESVERIFNSIGLMFEEISEQKNKKDPEYRKKSDQLVADFYSAMDNDFDTPSALSALFSLLRLTNTQIEKSAIDHEQVKKVAEAVRAMVWIFGLKEQKISIEDKSDALKKLAKEFGISSTGKGAGALLELFIKERENMRKKKDFKKADSVREKLGALGILLEDNDGTTRWKVK
jgi:cysteinyl-tRNA synthetase